MPSLIHEALVDLFRSCPTLAARLLAARQAIPSADEIEGELVSEDLSLVTSPEYRADAVLRLRGPGVDLALVVEVQLRRDPDKGYVWPVYVAVARARHRVATVLLVLTLDGDTARWAASPIPLGPGPAQRWRCSRRWLTAQGRWRRRWARRRRRRPGISTSSGPGCMLTSSWRPFTRPRGSSWSDS